MTAFIYVDFDSATSSGQVVAVDLSAGRGLWRSKLKALGRIAHFAYRSRFSIDANGDVVIVHGNESKGQYVEIKNADSGETVGHKIFDNPPKASRQ